MTYDTMNPVPSDDPRDLDDNAKALDRFLQNATASEPDRLGAPRKTWWQIEQDALALISPNISALAGLTGAADRGFYFTGSGAMSIYTLSALGRTLGGIANAAAGRTALTAAASGANGDITSMTGLTTALSAAQGGTGRTTTATYLADLQTAGAYGKTNVLGTVSQSGGVPTGAVVEAGAGYVRWADGTQMCYRSGTTASIPLTTAAGTLFSSADFATASAFAAPFIAGSVPVVTYSYYQASWYGFLATTSKPTATLWPSAKGISTTSTSTVIDWGMVALGHWF